MFGRVSVRLCSERPIAWHLKRACNVIQPYRDLALYRRSSRRSDDGRPGMMLNPLVSVVSCLSIERERADFHESEECFKPLQD